MKQRTIIILFVSLALAVGTAFAANNEAAREVSGASCG